MTDSGANNPSEPQPNGNATNQAQGAAASPQSGQNGDGHDRHGRREHGRGWWPFALIVVGLLFLAGNVGFTFDPLWNFIGNVWEFWPVALIAVGADMLTRGKYRLAIVSVAIGVVVVLALSGGLSAGVGQTLDVKQALGGATSARLELDLTTNALNLTAAASSTDVVWGTITGGRSERLTQDASRRGNLVAVTLRARQRGWPIAFGSARGGGPWELQMNENLATDLVIDGGVGAIDLDLWNANLTGLAIDAGVGALTITLPASGGFTGEIDGGVGKLTVNVPSDLAIVINLDTGVGNINFDSGFQKNGSDYSSPAAAAGQRVAARLNIDAGVGSVNVRSVK